MNDHVHVYAYVFQLWYFESLFCYNIYIDESQPPPWYVINFRNALDADKHTTWRKVEIYAHKTTKLRAQDW